MATFDQRGQTVNNQYNAARDINFNSAESKDDVIRELRKLLEEVTKAAKSGAIKDEVAVDLEAEVKKAVIQAEKPEPNKKSILEYLATAKELVEGLTSATGLITVLIQATEAVRRLL